MQSGPPFRPPQRTTAQPTAAQALAGLRRRLEKAELEHLREHITELANRLECAEKATALAENSAKYWREQCESLVAQMGNQVGLTVDGDLVAMPVEAGGDLYGIDVTQGGAA